MSRSRRSLSFQSLESRLPFAGDVAVTFINNNLKIIGGEAAENIEITEVQFGFEESLVIVGKDGTKVNGQTSLSFRSNNLRNIDVDLNGGDDRLVINKLDSGVAGTDYFFRLGNGNDQFFYLQSRTAGDLSVFGEGGDDNINVKVSDIGEKLRMELGVGDDLGTVSLVTAEDISFLGGNDEDQVLFADVDVLDQLLINLGDGDDQLKFINVEAENLIINGGIDDDDVFLIRRTSDQSDALASAAAIEFETVQFFD